MPARRSHKKSRAGCKRCKSRKIKCDEVHPRCGNCTKHGVACDFEHPEVTHELLRAGLVPDTPRTDTPSPAVSSGANAPATPGFDFQSPLPAMVSAPPTGFPPSSVSTSSAATGPLCRPLAAPVQSPTTPATSRLLELRLLHQYTTTTSQTFSFSGRGTEAIWRDTVPHVAFAGATHLTDAVLAVAALHLRSLRPDDKELVRASHAYMASSLREYSQALTKGIQSSNAEALFLTSTLIAFQSTATRIFNKDESALSTTVPNAAGLLRSLTAPGGYSLPLSWFHAFQGVKAITATAWPWLRRSGIVIPIINAQPVLQLQFDDAASTFFGHLLDDLDDELAALPAAPASPNTAGLSSFDGIGRPAVSAAAGGVGDTRQAYEHAVAVLNWAHKIPQKGAPLAFPATVSRRFVELLEARRPRALAILACFFALLKSLDNVWWLQGMARREVLGVVSLFNSDLFGPDVERRWWPHLQWAVRVALYDDSANPGVVPPDVWGTAWLDDDAVLAQRGSDSFVSHIELLSRMVSGSQSFPAPEPD